MRLFMLRRQSGCLNHFDADRAGFVDVLELARELKLLKLGKVSLDGTHLKANDSIDQNVSCQQSWFACRLTFFMVSIFHWCRTCPFWRDGGVFSQNDPGRR